MRLTESLWIGEKILKIAKITPHFTMQRMLDDYYERFYNKLKESSELFIGENFVNAKALSLWKAKILAAWDNITVEKLVIPDSDKSPIDFGKHFVAEVALKIPGLNIEDIGVEIIAGNRTNGDIDEIKYRLPLIQGDFKADVAHYTIEFPLKQPGVYDYAFRIYPKHKLLVNRMDFPLVKWI